MTIYHGGNFWKDWNKFRKTCRLTTLHRIDWCSNINEQGYLQHSSTIYQHNDQLW